MIRRILTIDGREAIEESPNSRKILIDFDYSKKNKLQAVFDYRNEARAGFIECILCFLVPLLLIGIPLILFDRVHLITIAILIGIDILCSILMWYHVRFHVVEFNFDKRDDTLLKMSVDFNITRHFFCKISDIDIIECRRGSLGSGGFGFSIIFRLKTGKKINFYNSNNKEELISIAEELEDFLEVSLIFPYDDSLVPWKDSTGREIYENITKETIALGVLGWFLFLIGILVIEINLWGFLSNPSSFWALIPIYFISYEGGSFYFGPIFIYAIVVGLILCVLGFLGMYQLKKKIIPGNETPKFLHHYEYKSVLLTCLWIIYIVAIIIGSLGLSIAFTRNMNLTYFLASVFFLIFGVSSLSISLIYYINLWIRSKKYWKKHGFR